MCNQTCVNEFYVVFKKWFFAWYLNHYIPRGGVINDGYKKKNLSFSIEMDDKNDIKR